MLDEAIAFAALAHAGQVRKYTGEPYVLHPIEVMTILRDSGEWTETMLVAALLHDVVEDCAVSYAMIERRFGPAVAVLVHELTEPERDGNRKSRKAAELARLSGISADAANIKLADLISNTKSIVEHDPGFAKVYLAEKQAVLMVLPATNATLKNKAQVAVDEAIVKLDLRP